MEFGKGQASFSNDAYVIFFVLLEAVLQRCFVKKLFLKILESYQGNTYAGVLFQSSFIKKRSLAQVFSYKFCEI